MADDPDYIHEPGWNKELHEDEHMDDATEPAPGWVGGFSSKYKQYAYPEGWVPTKEDPEPHPTPWFGKPRPDQPEDEKAAMIPIMGNMKNINLLTRQLGIRWPEFSWLTVPGDESSRCFQMFAPYLSRVGYTDEGRVYSIICPQQGVYSEALKMTINIEITVLGTRGWVNEDEPKGHLLGAEMEVCGTIWFSESEDANPIVKDIVAALKKCGKKFPFSKKDAIIVPTHRPGQPGNPVFPVTAGETALFTAPDNHRHFGDGAWSVGNIEVSFSDVKRTKYPVVNDFTDLVIGMFNILAGNMIVPNNPLTWNIWLVPPTLVDQQEWKNHAEFWRTSIDVNHGKSPTAQRSTQEYFDGTPIHPKNDPAAAAETKKKEEELLATFVENVLKDEVKSCCLVC